VTTRRGPRSQHAEGCPDRLGGSICRLLEVRDLAVTVQALEAIDGMPVLNLKPYMREFGARRPGRAGDLGRGAHSRILEHLRRELRARPGTYRISRWATIGTDLAPGRLHSRRSALC